jgi:hypothetical protein
MYKEDRCSICGFKIPKGDKAYDVGEGKRARKMPHS